MATVAAYAETLLPGRGGIGRYPKDANHPKRTHRLGAHRHPGEQEPVEYVRTITL